MPTPYFYFVVTAAGMIGTGDSVAWALAEAFGKKDFVKHYASQPRSGFHWGPYVIFHAASAERVISISRNVMIKLSLVYEKCEVYFNLKKTKHIMTVYRSINIATIAKLKDQYGQSNTPKKLSRSVKVGS